MPAIPFALSLGLLLIVLVPRAPAWAATCAAEAVSARGDPSRFEVLAKAKARGNWRAKVRAMPTLGSSYADYNKAQDASYRCTQEDGKYTCTAGGRPCQD
jgi:hypothetical protein